MTHEPIWDVYGFSDRLTDTEKAVLAELRTTLDEKVYPYLNDAWNEDRLPEEIIEPLESLRLMDPPALKEAGVAMFGYGAFITATINFLILAWIIFLLVKAVNRVVRKAPDAPAGPTEVELLAEIRDELKRK